MRRIELDSAAGLAAVLIASAQISRLISTSAGSYMSGTSSRVRFFIPCDDRLEVAFLELDGDANGIDEVLIALLCLFPWKLGFQRAERVEVAAAIPDPRELGVGLRDQLMGVREIPGDGEKGRGPVVARRLQKRVAELLFGAVLLGNGGPARLEPECRAGAWRHPPGRPGRPGCGRSSRRSRPRAKQRCTSRSITAGLRRARASQTGNAMPLAIAAGMSSGAAAAGPFSRSLRCSRGRARIVRPGGRPAGVGVGNRRGRPDLERITDFRQVGEHLARPIGSDPPGPWPSA